MTATEERVLLEQARSWKADVDPVDSQARIVIDAIRAKTPGGRLAPGEQPPTVPTSLIALQSQRDEVTLRHVAALQESFGPTRFAQLDKQIHRSVQVSMRGTPRPSQLTGETQAPSR
jgi:hypothetical protein